MVLHLVLFCLRVVFFFGNLHVANVEREEDPEDLEYEEKSDAEF